MLQDCKNSFNYHSYSLTSYKPIIIPTTAPAAIKIIGCLLILFVIKYSTINKIAALILNKSDHKCVSLNWSKVKT